MGIRSVLESGWKHSRVSIVKLYMNYRMLFRELYFANLFIVNFYFFFFIELKK